MAKDKEVAVQQPASTSILTGETIPDWMKDKAGMGTEALSSSAFSPPRLKMAQALSPELETMAGLKAGNFFSSMSEMVYGEKVEIIPCFLTESYLLFAPRVPGFTGGLLARADDGIHWNVPHGEFEVVLDKKGNKAIWKMAPTVAQSGLANWGTFDPTDKNSAPAATHSINLVCLVAPDLNAGPMVFSFVRSALKNGKKFASNIKMSRVPAFGRLFELSAAKVEGPAGPYYEPRTKAVGFVQEQGIYQMAKKVYEMSAERGVQVNLGDDEAGPAQGGAPVDPNANY
jgi:hypothetical protein